VTEIIVQLVAVDDEFWPEAVIDDLAWRDKRADLAWDLVEAVHHGLPPARAYRITIEPVTP
jgi:hypothetical protein